MSRGVFVYIFFSRGMLVLAEHSEHAGKFPSVVAQCLQRFPSSNEKFKYVLDGHSYRYLLQDSYAYCMVTVESVGRQLSDTFLENMITDFKRKFGGRKAGATVANSLTKGPVMKEQMKYAVEQGEENDRLSKVKSEVSADHDLMRENISKAMDRGVKLNVLEDKAEVLCVEADKYKTQAGQKRGRCGFKTSFGFPSAAASIVLYGKQTGWGTFSFPLLCENRSTSI